MTSDQELRTERRSGYIHYLAIPTRWTDNDAHGQVGDAVCQSFFETVIHAYLMRECGLDMQAGAVCAHTFETACRFHRAFSFPDTIDAGLRVGQLGNSSVRYEIGLFRQGEDKPAATGHSVHVFVARESGKPAHIPHELRASLVRLIASA